MELLQLKYFCDAAETQNFSKTAKRFLVPASNISQTVKRLEKELETPLFERQVNRIKLNDAGRLFYEKARQALDLLESAEETLKAPQKTQTIRINIHIARRIVMEVIEAFRKSHPEVHFVAAHHADAFSEKFDFVVTDQELSLPYVKLQVAEERFLLAYNRDMFSIPRGGVTAELSKLPFITMGSGSSIYEGTKKICARAGFTPNIVLQSEDPSYIQKCIELGLGIAVVPEFSWRGQFSNNIVLKNIGEEKRKIYVYKRCTGKEVADKFYDLLIHKLSYKDQRAV